MKILLLAAMVVAFAAAGLVSAVCVCAKKTRQEQKSNCLIVLGARVWPSGRMSTSLKHRCESALEKWQEGLAEYIIVCGAKGSDEPETEALVMRKYLVENGVHERNIILEESSVNTQENLKNAKEIMGERGWTTAAVVTSNYHVQRALWLAKDYGITACGIPARPPKTCSARVRAVLRESVSWVVYVLRKLTGKD